MGRYSLSGFFFFIKVSPCSAYRYIFSSKSMQSSLDCLQTLGFVRVKKEVGKGIRERELFRSNCQKCSSCFKKIFETIKINFSLAKTLCSKLVDR